MTFAILILAVFWLAYSNGANDNFKGVATLYGSGTVTVQATVQAPAGSFWIMRCRPQ